MSIYKGLIVLAILFSFSFLKVDSRGMNSDKVHYSIRNNYRQTTGVELYEKYCLKCHGVKGNKGFPRARKLTKSKLKDSATFYIIQKGKRSMPSFDKLLTKSEIENLVHYIKHFKK